METSKIEQLDKLRYNLLKWLTIGWAIWFGSFVLKNLVNRPEITGVVAWIGLLGWTIFIINLIQYMKLRRELRWDAKMLEALNDELHQLNMHKSFVIGYWVAIGTTALLFGLSEFLNMPVVLVTETILYLGVLSVLVSGLIYNRD